MVVPEGADGLSIEPIVDRRAGGEHLVFEAVAERAAEPGVEGDVEAVLAAAGDVAAEMLADGLAERVFAGGAADAQVWWDGPGELDEAVVEHGGADFQTVGHAGPIDLGEDAVGEAEPD